MAMNIDAIPFKIKNQVIEAIQARNPNREDKDDEHALEDMERSTPEEIFNIWMEWNGLMHWAPTMVAGLDALRAAKTQ